MEVVAIKPGVYGGVLRRVGARFDVPAGAKASWWAPVETEAAQAAVVPKRKSREAPIALSQIGSDKATSFVEHNRGAA